jgi:hypothetical protein
VGGLRGGEKMTKEEFNSYQRSIAYQIEMQKRGLISPEVAYKAIKIILGTKLCDEVGEQIETD